MSKLSAFTITAVLGLTFSQSLGGVYNWSGAWISKGDNSWGHKKNWVEDTPNRPREGDTANFATSPAYTVGIANNAASYVNITGAGSWDFSGTTLTVSELLTYSSSGSSVISCSLAGAGGLTVTNGSLTLSGASNSYAGTTTVSGGQLVVDSAGGLGLGNVQVGSSGKLTINGVSASNEISVADGGQVDILGDADVVLAANTSYKGGNRKSTAGHGTVAKMLGGTTQGKRTISSHWSSYVPGVTYSDVLDHSGTQGDLFVLQMAYDESLLDVAEDELFLGWLDGGVWRNIVQGNSDGGSGALFVDGAFDDDLTLGHYGRDTDDNVVWAVVDHNSFVAVVPEPAGVAMLSAAGLLLGRRGRSRRR